jgi:Heavy metal associated domain 2
MDNPPKKIRHAVKQPADPGKVTKLLAEARQVVDDLGAGAAAAPVRRKKAAAEAIGSSASRPAAKTAKKPASRSEAPAAATAATPRQPAPTEEKKAAAAKPVSAPPPAPLRSLQECGISVTHSLPGRLRLRVKSLQFDDDLARDVETRLAAIKGITGVWASPATGSVLITYLSREEAAPPLAKALQTWFPGLDTDSLLAEMLD